MYYAYKKIKKHQERKREVREAEERGHIPEPKAQSYSDGVDEEEPPGDPLFTGKPLDPVNRRSKKHAWWALLITGFALAIDFTMAMVQSLAQPVALSDADPHLFARSFVRQMSIQSFYYSLRGPANLFGLTFGMYDLGALLTAPVLGYISDKYHVFKILFLVCLVVNAIGNIIYAFTFLSDAWYCMLIARLVAGVGAGALGLGTSYCSETTTVDQRQRRLVTYRTSQSVARMVGPFIGYIFLWLPQVNSESSTALQIFNWYTIPGWVAFVVVAALIGLFWYMFVDPSEENEHIVRRIEEPNEATPKRRREFYTFCGLWMALAFFATLLQFGYYSNLFAVFAGQYHAITDQYDQWKVFLGIAGGACSASFIYRTGLKVLPRVFDERYVTIATSLIFVGAVLLVVPYDGATSIPAEATFYASTAMFGLGVVMFGPSTEIILSKKITQYQDVVGEHIAKVLGVYYMAHASGRFAGPLILAAVTYIATPSGQTYYCANGYGTDSSGNPICLGDTSTSCAIFPDQYFVTGCVLRHAVPVYSVWAGAAGVLSVAYMVAIWRWWSYDVVVEAPEKAAEETGG